MRLPRKVYRAVQSLEDHNAMQHLNLAPLRNPLPFSTWSLRPAHLRIITSRLLVSRNPVLVEFGSGPGSVLLTRAAAAAGGRVLSIEHDERWLTRVAAWQEQEGLSAHWSPVLAPKLHNWYDPAEVKASFLQLAQIDFLLIDGPDARTLNARWPVMTELRSTNLDATTIFIDDCDRSPERRLAEVWSRSLARSARFLGATGALALLPPSVLATSTSP